MIAVAKLSQNEIRHKADEWAANEKKCERARRMRDEDPVVIRHDAKIAKLQDKSNELASEIYAYLNAQTKDVEIATALAIAERKTQKKLLPRLVDVKKFLAKAKSKGDAMYECIRVEVQKAEKLLGDDIETISNRPEKIDVVTSLRLK